MAKITIGVDLGTTNTCAAIVKDGIAKFLELEPNSLTMPSAVRFVDGKTDNVVIGRLAKRFAIVKPKEVFVSFKTLMQNEEWLNDPKIVDSYKIDGKQYTPTDMAAKLLTHIYEVAQSSEFAAEGTINNVKICVPAASTPYYKKEVIKAAIQAGFGEKDENGEVIYIDEEIDGKKVSTPKGITTIEEPFAAAYSYGYKNGFFDQDKTKDQNIMVYDFGGGTFDVSIINVSTEKGRNPEFKLLGTYGVTHLGGDDIDMAIMKIAAKQFYREHKIDLINADKDNKGLKKRDVLTAQSTLKELSERAKIEDFAQGATFQPLDLKGYQKEKALQYVLLRDAYERLYRYESNLHEANVPWREHLNTCYDEFVMRYGNLNAKQNVKLVMMDAGGRDILSLERAENGKFVKADIFERPVSFSVESHANVGSPEEALSASLNKFGTVDLDYMREITDSTAEDLLTALQGRIYYNPLVTGYEIKDRFIAGNVIEKAERIEAWMGENPESERMPEVKQALEALKDAEPPRIAFEDLDFNFGERWIPTGVYAAYMSRLFDTEVKIAYSASMDEFSVACGYRTMKITDEFLVKGYYRNYDGMHLLKHALHNTCPDMMKSIGRDEHGNDIKVRDSEGIQLANAKIDEIRNGFSEWLEEQSPQFKERLTTMYNRKFNCFVRPKYDGSHQTFPDLNLKGLASRGIRSVYPSQMDCVWMLKQNGGGICDHEVGTGKTLIMCIAAHEMKRLNLAHKPMIIGLKANVAEIAATYQAAYPNARILYASEKDFSTANRVRFFNNIKNNDYDCVIMSHDQFGKIPQSPELQQRILQAELVIL